MRKKMPTNKYKAKKLMQSQNNQPMLNIEDNASRSQLEAITNDAKWLYLTWGTALTLGKKIFTRVRSFVSSSPRLRNVLVSQAALLSETLGFRTMLPSPVPINNPNICINLAIWNSVISCPVAPELLADYITKKVRSNPRLTLTPENL